MLKGPCFLSAGGHLRQLDLSGAVEVAAFDVDELHDLEFAANGDAAVLGTLSGELVLHWWNGATWFTEGLGVAGEDAELEFSGNEARVVFRTPPGELELYAGEQGKVSPVAVLDPDGGTGAFDFCTDSEGFGAVVSNGDGLWLFGL